MQSAAAKLNKAARNRNWYRENRAAATLYSFTDHIRRHFNITLPDFTALLKLQGCVCAICKQYPRPRKYSTGWCLDHNHLTGELRGLLCHRCNSGVGGLGDSVSTAEAILLNGPASPIERAAWACFQKNHHALKAAIAYLTSPPTRAILYP